MSIMYC